MGVTERFNTFIETRTAALLKRIRDLGVRGGDEQDVFQDACLKYYLWLGADRDPQDHEGMLWQMVYQRAMDELRQKKRSRFVGSAADDEGDPGDVFGPDVRPGPQAILLSQERDDRCRGLLAAAVSGRGGRLVEGLVKIAAGCTPSETVDFIESYLFHGKRDSSVPRSAITDQLCAQLSMTETAVAVNCHRLRPLWGRLKKEILGEDVCVRRWTSRRNRRGDYEKPRKTERLPALRPLSK